MIYENKIWVPDDIKRIVLKFIGKLSDQKGIPKGDGRIKLMIEYYTPVCNFLIFIRKNNFSITEPEIIQKFKLYLKEDSQLSSNLINTYLAIVKEYLNIEYPDIEIEAMDRGEYDQKINTNIDIEDNDIEDNQITNLIKTEQVKKFIIRIIENDDPFKLATITFLNSISNENTRRGYRHTLREFFNLFSTIHPKDILTTHIELYKKLLEERGKDSNTIRRKLSAISSFYRYLMKAKGASEPPLIQYNPCESVKLPQIDMYAHSKKITLEQAMEILNQIDKNTIDGAREYAIFYWMMLKGRRISEILSLKKKDLYTTGNKIYYKFKLKKSRSDSIDEEELPISIWTLVKYYWMIAGRKIEDDSPIFTGHSPNNNGVAPITANAIRWKLDYYCICAGLRKEDVTPHSFRHLAAQLMEETGATIREIQARLKHKNINTTQIYLNKIQPKDDNTYQAIEKRINELKTNSMGI